MDSILILVAVLAVGAGVLYFLMRSGRVEDQNGNNIPDRVEDVAAKVTKAVERPLPNRRKKNVTVAKQVTPVPPSTDSTLPDLTVMTKNELVDYARENDIKVSSRARKVDILDTILSTQTPENNA